MLVIALLQRLLSLKQHAQTVARRSELLWGWESIAKELLCGMQAELMEMHEGEADLWLRASLQSLRTHLP